MYRIPAFAQESDGTTSHAVVRYVLHRFFAKNLGWFLRGLEPHGGRFRNETQLGLEDIKEQWLALHEYPSRLRPDRRG